jgi:hypothetical protein
MLQMLLHIPNINEDLPILLTQAFLSGNTEVMGHRCQERHIRGIKVVILSAMEHQ